MICLETTGKFILDTPIGDIELVLCPKGLHGSRVLIESEEEFNPNFMRLISFKTSECTASPEDEKFKSQLGNLTSWFKLYFRSSGLLKNYGLPEICYESMQREFYKECWRTLAQTVPVGHTITYSDLAAQLGQKVTYCRSFNCGDVNICRSNQE